MRAPLALLLAAAVAAPLAAQTATASLSALSNIASTASAGGQTDFDVVPQGTPIPGAGTVFVQAHVDPPGDPYTSFTAIAYPQPTAVGAAMMERGYARGGPAETGGTSASATAQGAVTGPHEYLLTIAAAPGTVGNLRISWNAQAELGATIHGEADIGNDGTAEWTANAGTQLTRIPLTIGAQPTVVRFLLDGAATGTGNPADWVNYFADLFVGFEEDLTTTCTFTSYGQSCGPTLSASSQVVGTEHVVTLTMQNGFAGALALTFAGDQRLNLPFGGGCTLLCNATIARVVSIDATGHAQDSFRFPYTQVGRAEFQMLPVTVQGQNLVITASNGIELDCR